LITAFKEYPKSLILIINDDTTFPEGWIEMFINDHKKYPNDIISGSIQYFIGKNLAIKSFSEGFKGKNFGIFNHITNMIFNFAFVNTNLGGTLYPANTFKNNDFFDYQLFHKTSRDSDEFWQSCFIMMENKILRQSSKIYDYTQYILLKDQPVINKEENYKKNLIEFCKFFPKFRNIVEKRQNKILISLTSYKKRFIFLPTVIKSLENQSMVPNKIVLVLSKNDMKDYKLKIKGIDIITVKTS
jgi:GT2 family glycosyltransferase